jgi:glucokinase
MTTAIGIDIGGSKIAACILDVEAGTVLKSMRVPTSAHCGGEAVLAECVRIHRQLAAIAPEAPSTLGVGICELVDPRGDITSAATFDWRGIELSSAFECPVLVESDVRVAAVGEARLGAGRGHACFVYLTVGTGVAFTLTIDGVPYLGANGNALILGAPPVEDVASGAALARLAGVATAEEVFGTASTIDLLRRATSDLGRAMAWLVNALDPEVVIVGGGLGLRDEYRDAAIAEMRAYIEPGARDVPVVPAALGPDAGAIGAALMAAERCNVS